MLNTQNIFILIVTPSIQHISMCTEDHLNHPTAKSRRLIFALLARKIILCVLFELQRDPAVNHVSSFIGGKKKCNSTRKDERRTCLPGARSERGITPIHRKVHLRSQCFPGPRPSGMYIFHLSSYYFFFPSSRAWSIVRLFRRVFGQIATRTCKCSSRSSLMPRLCLDRVASALIDRLGS